MLELREMKSHPVSLKKSEQAKLSKTTTEILLACLERQPKNRPQDYPTLLLQLEYAVRNKGGLRALMHPTKPLWARPAVWGTAAALGVASLGYVATRPATTPVPSGSANGERLVIIEDPSDNRDQNLSQQYNDARKRLLSSDAAGALLSFSNAGLSAPQPTKNWCHLHVALCHWFLGQPAEAEKALEPLNPGIPGPTAAFFTEARPILLGTSTDQSHIHKAFPREGYECMGLLALGLKSWSQGDAKSAKEAWDSLLAGDAKKQSWAAAYRPWIEQLAKQATQIATLPQLRAEDPQLLANFEKTKQTLANLPASPIAEKAKKALNIHQEAISNAQQQSEAAMATKENAEINSFLATLHTHTLADLPQLEQTLKTKVFQAKLTKNRQAALADCFQQSHQLLEILPTELTPTQSEIRLHVAEGKVLMGKLLRVDKQQLVIQTGTVETPVDWTQLPAAAWLELAETNLDQMRKLEATDYYAKRQQLVSFALCTGQKYTAKVKAAALCREWPAFRETWAVLAPP